MRVDGGSSDGLAARRRGAKARYFFVGNTNGSRARARSLSLARTITNTSRRHDMSTLCALLDPAVQEEARSSPRPGLEPSFLPSFLPSFRFGAMHFAGHQWLLLALTASRWRSRTRLAPEQPRYAPEPSPSPPRPGYAS